MTTSEQTPPHEIVSAGEAVPVTLPPPVPVHGIGVSGSGATSVLVPLSHLNFCPICSSIVLPSWVYFWTTPSLLPPIQTLS